MLGGEGSTLKVQRQLMNVEVLVLEIHFVTKIVKMGSCKNHQCMINYCGVGRDKRDFNEQHKFICMSGVSLHKVLIQER